MTLEYRLIQKVNPRDINEPKKFYAKAVNRGKLSLRQLSKEIADISTVSIVDTTAVIESLILLIPKHITQGETVQLGDFGSFYVSLTSEGTEREEDFSSNKIKNIKIQFRPGKELKNAVSSTNFLQQQK